MGMAHKPGAKTSFSGFSSLGAGYNECLAHCFKVQGAMVQRPRATQLKTSQGNKADIYPCSGMGYTSRRGAGQNAEFICGVLQVVYLMVLFISIKSPSSASFLDTPFLYANFVVNDSESWCTNATHSPHRISPPSSQRSGS
jgi:hypothetical protein